MRPEANGIVFASFDLHVVFEKVGREHASFEQKGMIPFYPDFPDWHDDCFFC
jgi:hypothetical protein